MLVEENLEGEYVTVIHLLELRYLKWFVVTVVTVV
jgi:hypothetical protein